MDNVEQPVDGMKLLFCCFCSADARVELGCLRQTKIAEQPLALGITEVFANLLILFWSERIIPNTFQNFLLADL